MKQFPIFGNFEWTGDIVTNRFIARSVMGAIYPEVHISPE